MTTHPELVTFLPAADVMLLPGAAHRAEQTVTATLLRLDPARLLAPFRREAGLSPVSPGYDGWERDGLDGHTAGHVLSAASRLAAATGDARISALAGRLSDGLRECQVAIGTGYVGGVPDGAALWDELSAGRIEAGAFHLNGRWVPLYNLHKTVAGLLDAAEHLALESAEAALDAFGEWWLRTIGGLDSIRLETILETEFGGLTEAFARLALHRRDARYLALARRFARRALVDPLAAGRDELDGLHANTQVPVVVGYAAIERAARLLGANAATAVDDREGAAARTFFDSVAGRRSVALGGHGVREHFHAATDFSSMFTSREGPETCNTHNMVKLAAELHALTDEDRYLHFAERARRNHLISAQHPRHGGLVYFTSQRPGHYRVFSPDAAGFWCCMGSGYEAQTRHGALVYSAAAGELRINAFVASEARWNGVEVRQSIEDGLTTGVDVVDLTIHAAEGFSLGILIPDWVDGSAHMTSSGGDAHSAPAGSRVSVPVSAGTTQMRIELPRRLRIERAPDGSEWGWVIDGPDVLAQRIADDTLQYRAPGTRMGHIALGPLLPLADTPILAPDSIATAERAGGVVRLSGSRGEIVELEPFAGIHDARYTVSWPLADDAETAAVRRAALERLDEESLALEARTCDLVAFGEQQPESDHVLRSSDDVTGIRGDTRWRRTEGTIEVTLRDWSGTASAVRLSWLGDDAPSGVRVRVGGQVVLDERITAGSPDAVREAPLPAAATGEVEISVAIDAIDGRTPRLTELRVLHEASDR